MKFLRQNRRPLETNTVRFLYLSKRDAVTDSDFLAMGTFLSVASCKMPGAQYAYIATKQLAGAARSAFDPTQRQRGFLLL
jgi:hypothetical protein